MDVQLVYGGGTEGIGCRKHYLIALIGVVLGKLCDRGGLSDTVDTEDKEHGQLPLLRYEFEIMDVLAEQPLHDAL